ncbi:MAG: type IX secretion system outer membrane channel protein PorV [Bacteroidetes bacterium]|nr:type IX secretion system outer membrane channel protein PorV [Bacteroidota bacterium]MBU1720563.1 type IX secretion system outer membrane channel protein PorV [Bacteroidota bacterium]
MNLMKRNIVLVLSMVMLGFSANRLNAQSMTTDELLGQLNTITTSVPFLMISPDARAGGMGDIGVSTTSDAASIHWNPAKLAFVEKDLGVSVSYTPWLRALVPDINLAYLSGYKRIDEMQVIGMSLLYFSLGDITFTDVVGNTTGQFRPNEFAVDACYSRKLSEVFSLGVSGRFIYSNLTGGQFVGSESTHPGTSVAADVSFHYEKTVDFSKMRDNRFAVGLNISNMGSKIGYTETIEKDFIPINLRIGPSLRLNLDKFNTIEFGIDLNKLLVPTPPVYLLDSLGNPVFENGNRVIEYGKDNKNVGVVSGMLNSFGDAPGGFREELREFNIGVGAEYWYDKQFAIRAGYFYEHATKGNRKFFTLGLGIKYNVFGLDFAYLVPASSEVKSPLENTLRFTLIFDFDGLKGNTDLPN